MIPKFRCFDKYTKTMHEVVSIDFRDWRVYYESYGLRSYWNKNIVLMQFTGLYDNTKFKDLSEKEQKEWLESGKTADEWQGREIFEGDIVKYSDYEYSFTGIVTQDTVTCWWIKGIYPDDNFNFDDVTDYSEYTCDVKVIGNVHQHPELLEVT